MASIFFGNKVDMIIAATPSEGSYLIGYDLDGVLKQKDEFGIITIIGSNGPTGATGPQGDQGFQGATGPQGLVIDNILYKAYIQQTGTASPDVTEWINNTGQTITSIRDNVGEFRLSGFNNLLDPRIELNINNTSAINTSGGEPLQVTGIILNNEDIAFGVWYLNNLEDGKLNTSEGINSYIIITITQY